MPDDNKAIVRRLFDGISNDNLGVIDMLLADGFVEHEEMPGLTPDREGVKALFGMIRAGFPDFKLIEGQIVAEGECVSAFMGMQGTQRGEFMGMPATNKSVSVHFADFFRLQDGKVVEHWGVMDMAGLMQQLTA